MNGFFGMVWFSLEDFFLWFFLQSSKVIFNTKPEKTMKENSNVAKAPFIIFFKIDI